MAERHDMDFSVNALNDLRAQFVQALEAEPAAPPARAFRHPKRRYAIAFALVAVIAVTVAGVVSLRGGTVPGVQEATAGIADTAVDAPYPPEDWFTYSDEIIRGRAYHVRRDFVGPSFKTLSRRRAWLSVAKGGMFITQDLVDRSQEPVVSPYPASKKYRIGSKRYGRAEIDAFAVDPAPLLREINRQVASAPAGYEGYSKWTILTDALGDFAPPLPPELRGALIRELATVPGVGVTEADQDPRGRPAVGLYIDFENMRDTVYFSEATAAMTARELYALVDGAAGYPEVKKGEVIQGFEVLRQEAVPKIPDWALEKLSQSERPR
jgi:hypothetical protein